MEKADVKSAEQIQTPAIHAALYECWGGGPIVSNPKDCPERDTWRKNDDSIKQQFGNLELI